MNSRQRKILLEEKKELEGQYNADVAFLVLALIIIFGSYIFSYSILWVVVAIIWILFSNPHKTKSKIRKIDYKLASKIK